MRAWWRKLRLWQKLVTIAVGVTILWFGTGVVIVLLLVNSPLVTTEVSEKTLTRAQQLKALNEFSPVSIPPDASDIKIKYEKFQDWYFAGSFVLPPAELKAFTAKLTKDSKTGVEPGRTWYKGRTIGNYEGTVSIDAAGRVHIEHFSQ